MPPLSLSLCALGLLTAHSTYGVLLEKIMQGTYGPNAQRFSSSPLLILIKQLFIITTALVILFLRSHTAEDRRAVPRSFSMELRPSSSTLAYASVAGYTFLSTVSQFEALKYVSYTTQCLVKCARILLALLAGAVIYKKKYRRTEWAAGAVTILGCATYLFSLSSSGLSRHAPAETHTLFASATLGSICLSAYLFFGGLLSSTRERLFGKIPASAEIFKSDSPILNQMIWTNIFGAAFALGTCFLTVATGTLGADLQLLLTTPTLWRDICVFSVASAVELLLLLKTLTFSDVLPTTTLLAARPFLSIVVNAGSLGGFGIVGLMGWVGVAWVASGVILNMTDSSADKNACLKGDSAEARPQPLRYGLPVALPVVLILLLRFIGTCTNHAGIVIPQGMQGGVWDVELYALANPTCEDLGTTKPFQTKTRTAFVSFPRSGNSYLRSLVERATGYQTSSRCEKPFAVYTLHYDTDRRTPFTDCDPALKVTFLGECDHDANFFVKTHYPTIPKILPPHDEDHYQEFDQAVHLIRNPLDAVASWWHWQHSELKDGHPDHEAKVELEVFNDGDRPHLIELAKRWRNHALYWHQAPIRTHTMRYEDLRDDPIPQMMSLVPFLLPAEDRPSVGRLSCLAEKKSNKLEPYKSRKSSAYASWDLWPKALRMDILYITRRPFCAFAYDRLMREQKGDLPELKDFCKKVVFDMSRDGFYVTDTPVDEIAIARELRLKQLRPGWGGHPAEVGGNRQDPPVAQAP
ncbi:hypothetical protein P7C70_g4225, partial [Phenoliferia sp. Uapishka_3]